MLPLTAIDLSKHVKVAAMVSFSDTKELTCFKEANYVLECKKVHTIQVFISLKLSANQLLRPFTFSPSISLSPKQSNEQHACVREGSYQGLYYCIFQYLEKTPIQQPSCWQPAKHKISCCCICQLAVRFFFFSRAREQFIFILIKYQKSKRKFQTISLQKDFKKSELTVVPVHPNNSSVLFSSLS